MKLIFIVLQSISLLFYVLTLLKLNDFLSYKNTYGLLYSSDVSLAPRLLAMVFGVTILITLALPLRFSGQDQLMFGAGFGVCLGSKLAGLVGMKIGLIQTIASFALGTYARKNQSTPLLRKQKKPNLALKRTCLRQAAYLDCGFNR